MAFWNRFFKKDWRPNAAVNPKTQARDYYDNPYMQAFKGYIGLRENVDLGLYDLIRSVLPICDVAVLKRTRLIGDLRFDGMGNKTVQDALDWFYRNVKVGYNSKGWRSAQNQIVDSVYSKGFNVCEIVADENLSSFSRLKVLRANDFRFKRNPQGELELVQVLQNSFMPIILEKQDLIKYTAFDLRDGHPQGVSMYSSIPFLAQIITRIHTSVDNMVWRIGDPTMYGVYTPGDQETPDDAKNMVDLYRTQITESMEARRSGGIKDLCFSTGPGGNFAVKILGSEAKYFDISIPYRTITEQVIARFGLPPMYYGLSWSTTERMSTQQADMIVSEIENDRAALDATIEQVGDMFLILNGMAGAKWKHEWYPVNLQDQNVIATTRKANAEAFNVEITSRIALRDQGFIKDADILDFLVESGYTTEQGIKSVGREKMLLDIQERYSQKQIEKWARVITEE